MEPIEELLRNSGQYGPRVEVPADADAQTRLIAFIGRDPGWRGQKPPAAGLLEPVTTRPTGRSPREDGDRLDACQRAVLLDAVAPVVLVVVGPDDRAGSVGPACWTEPSTTTTVP